MNDIYKKNLKIVVSEIERISKELDVSPYELKQHDLLAGTDKITAWGLRQLGGMQAVLKAHFPDRDLDLPGIKARADLTKYIKQLELALAKKNQSLDLIKKLVGDIEPLKVIGKPIKVKDSKKSSEVVVMLNDLHFGLRVEPDEVGNLNSFGWKEACRRMAFLAREVCDFKKHKKDRINKLHIIINGDILGGIIHGLTTQGYELLTHQINGALHIFAHFLSKVAVNFAEIEVTGISGNHEDMPHRREGGRVTEKKYDSYANIVYYALSAMYRNHKNIKFNFPKTPYAMVDLPAGRAMVVHGDTVFSSALGNVGRVAQVEKLSNAIHKFNLGEISRGNPAIKMVLIGHVHFGLNFVTHDDVVVYIAPSLSGVDPYAHSLGINSNIIGQVILETTKDYIFGDSRLVRVQAADNDPSLDDIIPIYNNELSYRGNNGN